MSENEESEYGKGYAYCLGLFIAHQGNMCRYRSHEDRSFLMLAPLWFNGAADHLFDLQVPDVLPPEKKEQIAKFQRRCLAFRLCMDGEKCDWDDAQNALDEAKDLLREWDEFHNIPSMKGNYE